MSHSLSLDKNEDTPIGFFYGTTAYLLWGILPLYMKAMSHIPTLEIIGHRIIWSFPLVGLILIFRGSISGVWSALKDPKQIFTSILTAALLSINWGLYAVSYTHLTLPTKRIV